MILDSPKLEEAISGGDRVKPSLGRGVEGFLSHPWFLGHRGTLIYRAKSSTSAFLESRVIFGEAWGGSEGEHTLEEEGGRISFRPLNQLPPRKFIKVY